ncbi:anthranilate phosphoribosyltransferase [Solemya velesiana gill symbiont]|uniref:Anthranilate phosphoribosyltransferase n=1 Tax=Solemya velesiana gill symbiont TaxID=1918948 RepID=A0A1T2KU79_9GAMM|nr:anthranilate phosphoribosyltransferase [Solemya velesiana gill symbiont]OOZ36418.1 anthranilate phosphoribosyltransferase [Solemya velesiana gill symbiont]
MQDFTSEAAEGFRKRLIATAKGRHGAKDMSREEASEALSFLFSAEAHPAQVGAFLTAMRFKGTKVEEMKGFLDAMENTATLISPQVDNLVNCNGPYDGRKKALNLSVPAAIVAAAAGVSVVLHSNTGLPPKDGVTNARLLEAMGMAAAREPEQVEGDIERKGFGHLHASRYLHGVERLKPYRQLLFYRTFLHACEVMLNPAGARRSLIGAAHESFLERFATAAGERGQERVMVVQGLDGGDELPLAPTPVVEYRDGVIEKYTLSPTDFGMQEKPHHPCETPDETVRMVKAALEGTDETHLDAVAFNAGVRIHLGGGAGSIEAGISLAREALSSGAAADKLVALKG